MPAGELTQVKELFQDALSLPSDERTGFLVRTCGTNELLLREVLQLLDAHSEAAGFLATPAPERFAQTSYTAGEAVVGLRLGPYELMREIGQGGSSSVFAARRVDDLYEKLVAIKLLHRLQVDGEAQRRFSRELRILANLEHPYIVRLLDAGISEAGMAFIVMERVEGLPIDRFCQENALPVPDRLRLFLLVAEAVSAAHRSLVVHRDLKPSNILVTAEGVPKLLDFGIAVALEDEVNLTHTGCGHLTLPYASPEQIRQEKSITTATDVYSLGVVLHQMLTGRLPYRAEGTAPHELTQAILEQEYQPDHSLPGDLQAILARALEKPPARRYESVEAFRLDVRNYLDGLPVAARPHTALYRCSKFVARHRGPVAGVLLAVLLLAGALFIAVRQWRKAERNLQEALAIATQLHWSLQRALPGLQPELLGVLKDRAAGLAKLAAEYPDNPEVLHILALVLRDLGNLLNHPTGQSLGNTAEAVRVHTEAVRIGEMYYRLNPRNAGSASALSSVYCALGTALIEENRYPEALEQFQKAAALFRNLSVGDPDWLTRAAAYADVLANISRVHLHNGARQECLRLRREAVDLRRKYVAADPSEGIRTDLAATLATYGWALRHFGEPARAIEVYDESNRIVDTLLEKQSTVRLLSLKAKNNEQIGRSLLALGRNREAGSVLGAAVELFRRIRTLDPFNASDRRAMAVCLSVLAEAEQNLGRRPAARATGREALELIDAVAAADPANLKIREDQEEVRQRVQRLGLLTAPASN
ncbi:MAG: protein kinase [Acidobacteria bacterium]|nr:protein kinase [Acidobacteriota bacterium]